ARASLQSAAREGCLESTVKAGNACANGGVMEPPERSRRTFLLSSGSTLTGAWLATNWPAIVKAAEQSHHVAVTKPEAFSFLKPAEIADVDAITAQIVP